MDTIDKLLSQFPAGVMVLVFDGAMNLIAQKKPDEPVVVAPQPGIPPVVMPANPPQVIYLVNALYEPESGKIIAQADGDDVQYAISGLRDFSADSEFDVPAYQVREGKTFEVQARWMVNGQPVIRTTSVNLAAYRDQVPVVPDNPSPPVLGYQVIPAPVGNLYIGDLAGNRHIFDPVVQWSGGKARIRNQVQHDRILYWIDGGCPERELSTEYRYSAGDQVTIYAAITESEDVILGNFQPAYAVITIPDNGASE